MRKLKIWHEGARAQLRGESFSMTPYPPALPTSLASSLESWKSISWARGYWWAVKNRSTAAFPQGSAS